MAKTTKASKPDFDIGSCSARDLAETLVAVRGKQEACRILQEASKIAQEDTAVVSPDEKQRSHNKEQADPSTELLGKPLLEAPIETSFLSPRMGKFHLHLHENGLLATKTNDPSVKLTLLNKEASNDTAKVSHVLLFPKPEDCKAIVYNRELDEDSKPKKVGGNLVVLYLEAPLQIPKQKSPTQQLCFALPADKKLGLPIGPSLVEDDLTIPIDPTEAWGSLLHKSLGGKLAQVLGQKDNFKSYQAPNISTTTSGMPFVSCYLGVNDGVLYPLQEGLLFYKPPRFLPRSDLHSIACGRGGGGGGDASRYVDMVVQCNSKDNDQTETVEFTNIQREENSVLNSYIHDVLVPAMKRDATEGPADNDEDSDLAEVQAVAADEDDTEDDTVDGDEEQDENDQNSDSDDEDFDDGSDGDSEDGDSSDEDDDIDYGEDDEGIAVVKDDFAQELVKRKNEEESATESEDEDSSQPRTSKRLRQK